MTWGLEPEQPKEGHREPRSRGVLGRTGHAEVDVEDLPLGRSLAQVGAERGDLMPGCRGGIKIREPQRISHLMICAPFAARWRRWIFIGPSQSACVSRTFWASFRSASTSANRLAALVNAKGSDDLAVAVRPLEEGETACPGNTLEIDVPKGTAEGLGVRR